MAKQKSTKKEIHRYSDSKLPDRPSKLLKVALKDFEKAEERKDVEIDMSYWAEKTNNREQPYCVCLAGAVMIGTLNKLEEAAELDGAGFDLADFPKEYDKLSALSFFSFGSVPEGLTYFVGFEKAEEIKLDINFAYVPYHESLVQWWAYMDGLVTALEERGL